MIFSIYFANPRSFTLLTLPRPTLFSRTTLTQRLDLQQHQRCYYYYYAKHSLFSSSGGQSIHVNFLSRRILLQKQVRMLMDQSNSKLITEDNRHKNLEKNGNSNVKDEDEALINPSKVKDKFEISAAPENITETKPKVLGAGAKLKLAVRDYGGTVLVFHVTMSLISLGSCYVLVSSGLDVVDLLGRIGVSEDLLQSKITQGGSTFIVAYAFHKIFAPLRLAITLTAVPFIVKKLRAMGILKKPV